MMAETCINFSKLLCEVDEVKALLISNDIKEDVNVNNIFEKLERRTNESGRVNEVVREIIGELNGRDPDLIILDQDQNSPEVEVLVDLSHDYPDSAVINEFGGISNKAQEIFEHERGVKRGASFGPYQSPETSKRVASNVSLSDYLFEDSIPLEEVALIEEVATLPTEEAALSAKPIGSEEDVKRFRREGTFSDGGTLPVGGSGPDEVVNLQTASDMPGGLNDLNREHVSNDAESSVGDLAFNNSYFEEGTLRLEDTTGMREVNVLPTESGDTNGQVLNRDLERKVTNAEDVWLIDFNSPERNVEDEVIPTLIGVGAPTSSSKTTLDKQKMLGQLDYLTAIFPHLEPSYLEGTIKQFSGNERLLNEFIRSVFEGDLRLPGYESPGEPKMKSGSLPPSSTSKASEVTPARSHTMTEVDGRPPADHSVPVPQNGQVDVVGSSNLLTDMGGAVGSSSIVAGAESLARVNHPAAEMIENVEGNEDGKSDQLKANLYAEQLQYLVAVLPDADPTFLEGLVRDMEGNGERLKDFVANALENDGSKPMYPTREESLQKQEEEALVKRFTNNFSVEDFLQVFPDPIGHFESETREIDSKYREHFMAYLRSRFRNMFINDIVSTLRKKKFNLTLTVQDLNNWKGIKRKSKRAPGDCKWPKEQSISFLQEVAYIENKDKIVKYLEDKKSMRQKAYDEAKANNQLLVCGCCFDDELLPDDMSTCRDGHLFCVQCIKKGAEVIIGDGKLSFPCMDGNCKAEFSLATLQAILVPAVFGRLVQRLQAEEINAAGIEGLETCPSCPYSTIPAPEDKIFKCLNPDCMKETCRNCKEPSHIPLRCDEVEKSNEIKARTYIEDKMTEALVRTCWKCNKKFIKEGGCNKMSCSCGALMCYICRQPVKDYTHFNPYKEQKSDLCPLYSNDGQLNFEAVKAEAEKAKEEVMRQNPEVRLVHDPTLKLPQVPSTSKVQAVPPLVDQILGGNHNHLMEFIMEHVGNMHHPYLPEYHGHHHRYHANHRRMRVMEVQPVAVRPYHERIPQHHQPHVDHNYEPYPHGVQPAYHVRNRERPAGPPNRHHVYPAPPSRNPAHPHHH